MPSCPTFCPLPLCQVFHFLSLLLQKRNVAENIHLLYEGVCFHFIVSAKCLLWVQQWWWPTWSSFQASFGSPWKKNVHSLSQSLHAEVQNVSSGLFLQDAGEKYHSFEGQLRVESTYVALFQGALQHKRWGSVACVLHSCWDLTGVSVALQAVKAVGYRGGLPVEDHSHILGLKEVWIG